MTDIVPIAVNGDWTLNLPEHRAARPEWPWWEATRLHAERHAIRTLRTRLARPPIVWSVGAEEGDFPALYALWGAKVCLIEPNPKVWPNIKLIWDVNGLPDPLASFVGLVGADEMINLAPTERDTRDVFGDPWPADVDGPITADHGFRHLADGRASTPTTTLDELAFTHGWPTPDLVTMDIEGGEDHALAGAARLLAEVRPHVFVSIHHDFLRDLYGLDAECVNRRLDRDGYSEKYLTTDHEAHWWFRP